MAELERTLSFDTSVEQARDMSVQSRATMGVGGNVWLVHWMANAGSGIAPWWSPTRDVNLREFWKDSDHLAGAVYTMVSKMTAIPNKVIARDQSIIEHVKEAEEMTMVLRGASEFGENWPVFYGKFVEDLLTQDNGAFAEVIGPGAPSGPIVGRPVGVAHLDSYRCMRTGDPEYPVVYSDSNQKQYRLHRSRVIYTSQMSSPISDMFGVGFCAVSRCINVAQTLVDILVFKQEKLGSRPHRSIIITRGGLDPKDIQDAFQVAEGNLDSQGLTRYSKVVVGGSSSMPESDVKVVELSSMPDGFNEETSITLGMATIALAFGVDARELFPSLSSGSTRADALLQHLKQRGKGPGQILEITEQLINYKFLPPHLRFEFDFQDDAQDRQVAEIRKIRTERHRQALATGTVDVRTIREQMLNDGDLERSQFERLELADGRLMDGSSILSLFFSKDKDISGYLDLGVENPTDIQMHSGAGTEGTETVQKQAGEAIVRLIRERIIEVNKVIVNAKNQYERWPAYKALMALIYLEKQYEIGNPSPFSASPEEFMPPLTQPANPNQKAPMPGAVRTSDLTSPNKNERSTNVSSSEAKPKKEETQALK